MFQNIDIQKLLNEFIFDKDQPLIFSSGFFIFLFTGFILIYALLHKTHFPKVIYVLLFSLYFYYKSSGYYFIILIFCIFFDFFAAHLIHSAKNKNTRGLLLAISLVVNLGILFYFKYTNFFVDSYNTLSGERIHRMNIILPVGVSFFTFQSMSYTIDVFRKKIEPVKNILDYGFFVSFFPQLVAGPIVRAIDFIPQLYKPTQVTREMLGRGIFLIATGLFKKSVISDYISLNFVDRIFDNPSLYSGIENLFGVYGYALQIYCDFSGYSDMAIGIALLLGFRFPLNFDSPYKSQNITEFWRRWHISLSTWLKDYLYFSLGGNRSGNFWGYFFPMVFFGGMIAWGIIELQNDKYWPLIVGALFMFTFLLSIISAKNKKKSLFGAFNQMTTMLLGGFWHGASMRFILWGALHGLALAIHKSYLSIFRIEKKDTQPNYISRFLGIFITFHFVCFCWIFFRATSMQKSWEVISQIMYSFDWKILPQMLSGYKLVFILMAAGFILHFVPVKWENKFKNTMINSPYAVLLAFLFVIVVIVAQVKSSEIQPFIYFQF